MDTLPDELLLMVLSRIDDGLTLLDAVPLVCKRWYRLSRDPGAWNSVTVSIGGCFDEAGSEEDEHDSHDGIQNAARILLHAPALRRVDFCFNSYSSDQTTRCSFGKDLIPSALGRCQAEVREILVSAYRMPSGMSVLLDFLCRNESHVQCLKIGYMLQAGSQFERTLGQCENLEELHIMLPSTFQYQGGLRGRRLPKLKRLTLEPSSSRKMEHCRPFLRDLIGCVAQSVRHIHCEGSSSPSEDVLAELPRCVELRSLHCDVEGVAFATTLDKLRSLSLMIGRGDQDQLRMLSSAEHALRACGELQGLRELRLERISYIMDANCCQAVLRVLTTLGTKIPNVTHVSTSDMLEDVFPETVLALFKSLPRLESVHIDLFRFDNLPGLAEVPGIKRLSGEVSYRYGERDTCCAAIALFKRQRPELDCTLSVSQFCNTDDANNCSGLQSVIFSPV